MAVVLLDGKHYRRRKGAVAAMRPTCTADAHRLHDAPTLQLLQRIGRIKCRGLAARVGLDAAHVVRLHGPQLSHQISQLTSELPGHGSGALVQGRSWRPPGGY